MYVQRNIGARSCNHYCGGKAVSITYCQCVFVTLSNPLEIRNHHFVIRGLCGCSFFHIIFKRHEFTKQCIQHNLICCFV